MKIKRNSFNLLLMLFISLFSAVSFAGDFSRSCNWGGDNDLICPDNYTTAFVVNHAGKVGKGMSSPAVLCSKPNGDRLEGLASDECYYFWLDDSSISHLVIPWNSKEEIESLQEYLKRIGGSNSGSCTGKKGSTVTLKGSANSPEWDCSVAVAATPPPVFKPKRLLGIWSDPVDQGWYGIDHNDDNKTLSRPSERITGACNLAGVGYRRFLTDAWNSYGGYFPSFGFGATMPALSFSFRSSIQYCE